MDGGGGGVEGRGGRERGRNTKPKQRLTTNYTTEHVLLCNVIFLHKHMTETFSF